MLSDLSTSDHPETSISSVLLLGHMTNVCEKLLPNKTIWTTRLCFLFERRMNAEQDKAEDVTKHEM